MKKIPVGQTIAHAYGFAFREFWPLLKLTWLPLIVVMLGNMLVQPQLTAFTQGLPNSGILGVTLAWPILLLLVAALFVFSIMWMTAVYQFALGKPEARDRWYYFSLARPMWRVFGGFLLLLLVMLALLVVYVLAILALLFLFRLGLGAAHISDTAMKGIATFDVILAFLIGYCGFIFCAVRFGFLLFAATIAEDRIALTRSWTLSHGNFWRMFVIALAVFLPLLIIEGFALFQLGIWPHIPAGASAAEIRDIQRATNAAMTARMQHYWYFVYPGGTILAFLIYSLAAGTQAFAYRALTGEPPNPPGPTARSPAPPTQPYQL